MQIQYPPPNTQFRHFVVAVLGSLWNGREGRRCSHTAVSRERYPVPQPEDTRLAGCWQRAYISPELRSTRSVSTVGVNRSLKDLLAAREYTPGGETPRDTPPLRLGLNVAVNDAPLARVVRFN